ncbi:MAG: hypothetical protein AAF297_05075 [Planctomycetota bacterium]
MTERPDLSPFSRRAARRFSRRLRRWSIGVAGYTTVVFAGGGVASAMLAPPDAADGAWGSTVERIESARVRVAELSADLAVLDTALRAERAASGRPDWSLLFRFIAEQTAGLATLDELTVARHPDALQNEAYIVSLRGRASGTAAAARVALALESSGVFTRVDQSASSARRGDANASTPFEIRAVLGEPAPPPPEEDAEGEAGG